MIVALVDDLADRNAVAVLMRRTHDTSADVILLPVRRATVGAPLGAIHALEAHQKLNGEIPKRDMRIVINEERNPAP